MLNSCLCDYSDASILLSCRITVIGGRDTTENKKIDKKQQINK